MKVRRGIGEDRRSAVIAEWLGVVGLWTGPLALPT